jgi:hypothetical protein
VYPKSLPARLCRHRTRQTYWLPPHRARHQPTFVGIAAENVRRAGLRIEFEQRRRRRAAIHGPVCRAAFKNFVRPLQVLDEMHRVLKHRARLRPSSICAWNLRREPSTTTSGGRGIVSGTMIKLTFHTMLKKRAYTKDTVSGLVAQSQFRQGEVRSDPIGFRAVVAEMICASNA